jgi:hypothetical protein
VLVEEGVADRTVGVLASEPRGHRIEIGRAAEDVGAQPSNRTLVELEHRPVHLYGLELLAAQDEPRTPQDRRPTRPHEPAPAHTEVAPEHDPALEAQQEVLADRLNGLQPQAVQAFGHSGHRGARMRRLGLDALPDERLETAGGAMHGVALGHDASVALRCRFAASCAVVNRRARAAVAGAAAATVWALLEPLDRRVLRCDYSDVAVLGKAFTGGRGWRPLGLALHTANGAAFGVAFDEVRQRSGLPTKPLALGMALGEHVALYPLGWFVDRYHPARGEEGVPPLLTNPRAFLQATWRHALFGVVLGRLLPRA